MKKLIIALLFYLVFIVGCSEINLEPNEPVKVDIPLIEPLEVPTFKLANWNIQIFGKSKWEKLEVKERILEILPDYDIIFIQEIREKSGDSFNALCEAMKDYGCAISSRAGRSSSKEQYGVLWKQPIEMIGIGDYNPDQLDRWERPPIEVTFNVSGYIFRATNIHAKPSDVDNELKELETLYLASSWAGNRVWLGDLNTDGTYYDEDNKNEY